jgi:hypothetical protein
MLQRQHLMTHARARTHTHHGTHPCMASSSRRLERSMLAMSAALGFFCAAMSSCADRAIIQWIRHTTKCDGGTSISASARTCTSPESTRISRQVAA